MANVKNCPKCGVPVAARAPEGLCPACLLRGALNPRHSHPPDSERSLPGDELMLPPGGTRSFGDYELLELIAHGGMGVVWRARQPRLNRVVALKMIRAGRFAESDDVRRFLLEAEALAGLEHPNIVPIYEFGEHDGRHFFTMKLMEGGSLAERLLEDEVRRTTGSMLGAAPAPGEAGGLSAGEPRAKCSSDSKFDTRHWARALSKVACAVHYAHQRGILHRDLKPANILLDANSEPLVSDFGLAKRTSVGGDFSLSLTMVGSPNYMAPEQACGDAKHLTTAADIWSLGAILYHMLAGRPPFCADSPLATLKLVVENEPVPPRHVARSPFRSARRAEAAGESAHGHPNPPGGPGRSVIDKDLETICLKCLRKDPRQRYGTAEALAEDLERWLQGEPILARPSTVWERVRKWAGRHPARAGLLALALVTPAVIIALLLVDEARLRRERVLTQQEHHRTLQQEQKTKEAAARAEAEASRAEAGELAARERAYSADVYAAFQALSGGDLATARRLLDEYGPLGLTSDEPQLSHDPSRALASSPRTFPDLRGFEWRVLWDRARGLEAFAFTNLARPAQCLALAPDGRTLLSGGDDGIHLWDIVDRRHLGLFPGPDPGLTRRDLAPTTQDLRPMLDASPAVVEYIKVQPGIFDYLDAFGHTNRTRNVRSLFFTADQKHLLVGSGDLVRSWNFETRTFDFAIPEAEATVAVPVVGDVFVVGNDQRLGPDDERRSAHPQSALVYSFTQRRLVAQLPGFAWRVAISPDGQYVAAASQTNGAVLWHPATGETVRISHGPRPEGLPIFSPDGRTLVMGSDSHRPTTMWDVSSKRIIADFSGERVHVGAMAWSSDGRFLATGGGRQTVQIWTLPPAQIDSLSGGVPLSITSKIDLHGHEDTVTALAFSPDGRWLISAAQDHSIRFWSIADLLDVLAPAPSGLERPIYELAMDPMTDCILGRVGGELTLWHPQRRYEALSLPGTENQLYGGFLAGGAGFVTVELSTNGLPTHLEVRTLSDGVVQSRRELLPAPETPQSDGTGERIQLAASPNGQWLAVQREFDRRRYINLHALATGRFAARLTPQLDAPFSSLRFTLDSRLLILTQCYRGMNSISLFDTDHWQLSREMRFRTASEALEGIAVDPTSRFLATSGAQSSLRIWDLHTGRLLAICESRARLHPAWSRDGRTLAVSDRGMLRFWSMVVFRELAAFPMKEHEIPLGFTADDLGFVTITADAHVRIWSPPTFAAIDGPRP